MFIADSFLFESGISRAFGISILEMFLPVDEVVRRSYFAFCAEQPCKSGFADYFSVPA